MERFLKERKWKESEWKVRWFYGCLVEVNVRGKKEFILQNDINTLKQKKHFISFITNFNNNTNLHFFLMKTEILLMQ
jgi:hypothetical protein